MTNEKFVKSIMPLATCKTLHDSPFGVGPEYNELEPVYVVYDIDKHERAYIVGFSLVDEQDAWLQVAETFRKKMLSQLEGA